MSPIVNMPALLQTLENFYLSQLQTQTILVNLASPINDYIYIIAERDETFSQCCFKFLTQLGTYLRRIGFVYETANPSQKYLVNGVESKKRAINAIYSNHFTKYAHTFGKFNTTFQYNPDPNLN